jgi:hypothetical protein
LAQGPDEKSGLAGRNSGLEAASAIDWLSLSEEKRSGGGAWPVTLLTRGRWRDNNRVLGGAAS